ncbi:P1 family peptidase [Barrientosiimonas marina]|uniref:P1 family peptidase n=1 Tax=Lentibacillus kimchii TaxID=1542911 RepID=A0ABW2USH1_9BACI
MQLPKGPNQCITDVPGVKTGHVTLYEPINHEDTICTGVTAILPHTGNLFQHKVRAASHIINGYGKTAGLVQVNELGLLESPIMLTNTFSVGAIMQGTLQYMLEQNPEIGDTASSLNLVVGECNDSYLNSMRLQAVKPDHAVEAIEQAADGPIEEGAVGAGKGMVSFDCKGGIGTASRVVDDYTVGGLVLSNFGKSEDARFADFSPDRKAAQDGSIMIVIATDAPLDHRQLERLAKRSAAGLGRTGSYFAHGSGDIAIAFSTANQTAPYQQTAEETITAVRDTHPIMNKLFQAVADTTEDAIISSLKHAETTTGRKGRVVEAGARYIHNW